MTPKIVAFAGSLRHESFNRKVLATAVQGARDAGADVTVADLRDYPMPIYDADWHVEHGVPPEMLALRKLMISSHGLLIASPEYNASITPLLKNTVDWLSQEVNGESGSVPFAGRVCGLMGASNGAFGTIRALPHVSYILSNLGVLVLPVVAIPKVASVLGPDGSIQDKRTYEMVHGLGRRVTETIIKLKT